MKVIIPDVAEKNFLIPYHITREQVEDTVTNEDVKKVIKLGNLTLILFLKNFKDHYLFVDSKWDSNTKLLQVTTVLIVPEQFIRNISIDNPLSVLEQYSNEVGYNIEIEDQNAKFIHDATIRLPISNLTESQFVRLLYSRLKIKDDESKKAGAYIGNFLFRRIPNTNIVDISLAYFISVQKYGDYLRANELLD